MNNKQKIEEGKRVLEMIEGGVIKPILLSNFHGYACSSIGNIYSLKRAILMKQSIGRNGRKRVCLYSSNRKKNQCFHVHKLVALAWCDNPINKPFVCHRDGDKLNNNADNLYWGTQRENTEDSIRHGTYKGDNNGNSKLNEDQVKAIRVVYKMIPRGNKERFASLFDVHPDTIKRAARGDTWENKE